MFLIIPLSLILASLAGIFIIVLRRVPELKKATSSGRQFSGIDLTAKGRPGWKGLFSDFFPEISASLEKIKFKKYKAMWLMELEKFLRKIRLFFLRFDRLSETLISKIRHVHINSQSESEAISEANIIKERPNRQVPINVRIKQKEKDDFSSFDFLQKEEQRLIMEIARNPKNPVLYETLGDLYLKMSNFEDAKESFRAGIELNPQNESLKQKLSLALEKTVASQK